MTDLRVPDYSTMGSVFYPQVGPSNSPVMNELQTTNIANADMTPAAKPLGPQLSDVSTRTILKKSDAPKPYRIGATLSKSEPVERHGMRVVSEIIYDVATVQLSDEEQSTTEQTDDMSDKEPSRYKQLGQFVDATRVQYDSRPGRNDDTDFRI